MPVVSADILQYTSEDASSTGGLITGSTITSGIPNNVWADITDGERIAGTIKYRKTFWKNTNATDSLLLPVIFISVTPTNATLHVGLGVNHTDDDNSAQGNMTAFGATALVAVISTGADTRVVTIYGLDGSGNPQTETVNLNGTSEVLSANTYSALYAVWLASTHGSNVVTIKQGAGGTSRGSIGANEINSWLWLTATSKGAGIKLPNLLALQNYGVWRRLTVSAGAGPVRPNTLTVRIEENA